MAHTPDGGRLDKTPKPKPGQLLLPSDFELKFWIFGGIALVLVVLQAFAAALSPVAAQTSSCVTLLMIFLFWVESLRLLHRTVRLLSPHRRPASPTALVVTLLIPVLNALVRLWALPTVAIRVNEECRSKGVAAPAPLLALGIGAAILGLGAQLTSVDEFAAQAPLVAGALGVSSLGLHIWYFVLLQRAAHALAVHRHDRANAAGVAATFE